MMNSNSKFHDAMMKSKFSIAMGKYVYKDTSDDEIELFETMLCVILEKSRKLLEEPVIRNQVAVRPVTIKQNSIDEFLLIAREFRDKELVFIKQHDSTESYLMKCINAKKESKLSVAITNTTNELVKSRYPQPLGDKISNIMKDYDSTYYKLHLEVLEEPGAPKFVNVNPEFINAAKDGLKSYIKFMDDMLFKALSNKEIHAAVSSEEELKTKDAKYAQILKWMDDGFDLYEDTGHIDGPKFMHCPSVRKAAKEFLDEIDKLVPSANHQEAGAGAAAGDGGHGAGAKRARSD